MIIFLIMRSPPNRLKLIYLYYIDLARSYLVKKCTYFLIFNDLFNFFMYKVITFMHTKGNHRLININEIRIFQSVDRKARFKDE